MATGAPAAGGPTRWEARRAELLFRSAEWLGMHLPRRIGLSAGERYQRIWFRRAEHERAVVAANLARVLGHPPESEIVRRATWDCFLLYGRYWYETFALRTMTVEEVERRFSIDGMEHLAAAARAGRGGIAALPHMGNWDAAGHWLALQGYRMTAVAEELRPQAVFDLFYRHRRALGMNIVPLSRGARVAETLVGLLANNHILTLVADRDLTGRGVEVEMFGATRLLPAGPAMLSLSTGAPLMVAAVFTTDEGWHTRINAPIEIERTGVMRQDVTATMRAVAAQFERLISAAPTDWHMFQPAWGDAAAPAAASLPGA